MPIEFILDRDKIERKWGSTKVSYGIKSTLELEIENRKRWSCEKQMNDKARTWSVVLLHRVKEAKAKGRWQDVWLSLQL